jgi:hypothetical protein
MTRYIMAALLLLSSPVFGQQAVDLNKDQLSWTWSQGQGLPVDGFRMKCGIQTKTYAQVSEIPSPAARAVPIAKIVPTSGTYFCAVAGYAKAQESPLSNEVNFTATPAALAAPSGLTAESAVQQLQKGARGK